MSGCKTAILVSGSGTNLQAFIDQAASGDIDLDLCLVFSNRPDAYGLIRAANADIDTACIGHGDFADRESFDRAVAIDPTFAKAYGYISVFWDLQLQSNQMAYGITEEPVEVLKARRNDALDNAIRYEKDPVQRLVYEAERARDQRDFRRALRLRQEFFDAKPTADIGIGSLFGAYRDLGMHREVTDLIKKIYAGGQYPERFANAALQSIRTVEDAEFMREFTQMAVDKYGENANLLYQAHRQLLWAGDIDGASNLVPRILSSRIAEDNLELVSLRQACAEKNLAAASDIHNRILEKYPDEFSVQWLAYGIMGDTEAAAEMFVPYDERKEFERIMDYLPYAHFDPRRFPNFMEEVAGQGLEDREVLELPYRCSR